jgi:hypothetical protein
MALIGHSFPADFRRFDTQILADFFRKGIARESESALIREFFCDDQRDGKNKKIVFPICLCGSLLLF